MANLPDPLALPVALGEAKAFLGAEAAGSDAALAAALRAATALGEEFIGAPLIVRRFTEPLAASTRWQALRVAPVVAIDAVELAGGDLLAPDGYALDIDARGEGWVRLTALTAAPARVRYRAGLAAEWNGVAEPLRLGILHLAGYLLAAPGAAAPPAAVAALWRPYRRLALARGVR